MPSTLIRSVPPGNLVICRIRQTEPTEKRSSAVTLSFLGSFCEHTNNSFSMRSEAFSMAFKVISLPTSKVVEVFGKATLPRSGTRGSKFVLLFCVVIISSIINYY